MNIKQMWLGILTPSLLILFAGCATQHVNHGPIIPAFVYIAVVGTNEKTVIIQAKVDTGATRSALSESLVKTLGLKKVPGSKISVSGANGTDLRNRYYARIMYCGKVMNTIVSEADRRHLQYDMVIGREDLSGFLVNPSEPVDPDGGEFWFDTTLLEENPELNRALSCHKEN